MERYSDEAIRIINELHTERLDYQSEYIPLIDAAQRLDAYESTGMEPETIGALCKELNQYKDAVERMGNFGRLFVQYSGDPRGQMGHRGNRNDEIENATMFSTIEDVEGDVWRPVLERVLQSLIQRTKKAERERDAMRDAAIMQQKYQCLYDTHKLSKKAMCELCVPFRDKYGLTDLQTLRIARKEMDLMEMVELLQPKEE